MRVVGKAYILCRKLTLGSAKNSTLRIRCVHYMVQGMKYVEQSIVSDTPRPLYVYNLRRPVLEIRTNTNNCIEY